jgi:5'-3' exonuclease
MNFNNVFEQSIMNPTFIFVDGSYYSFHRYYALTKWWKIAFPDEPLTDPINNATFVNKFRNTFVKNLKEMPRRLKINKKTTPIMILGKDCKRRDIWRNELCSTSEVFNGEYKGNRKTEGFMGLPLFKLVQDEDLFVKGGIMATLKHTKLEADDCIAISVKYVLEKYPTCKIYIMTSDKDYLQLAEERVEIYNLSYKKITDLKSCSKNAKYDLFYKIIMGDPSDNIKPIFKNCGPKTTLKYFENPEYFEECLKKENAHESYLLNKKLVDFNEIPTNLVNEFIQMCIKCN